MGYDDLDRVETVVNRWGNEAASPPLEFSRDATGNVAQSQDDNSDVVESYVYDSRGQRAGTDSVYGWITHDGSNRYDYDDEGNVVKQWRFETLASNRKKSDGGLVSQNQMKSVVEAGNLSRKSGKLTV